MDERDERRVLFTTNPAAVGRLKRYPIFVTPEQGTQKFVVLGACILFVKTHWDPDQKKVSPHFESDDCELCEVTKPVWLGFAAALLLPSMVPGLMPVPASCWANSESLQRHQGNLRGRQVWAQRRKATKRGPVQMAVVSEEWTKKLPPAFDVTEAVCRHLGIAPANLFDQDRQDGVVASDSPLSEEDSASSSRGS